MDGLTSTSCNGLEYTLPPSPRVLCGGITGAGSGKSYSRVERHWVWQREVLIDVVGRQRGKRAAEAVSGHVQRPIIVLRD